MGRKLKEKKIRREEGYKKSMEGEQDEDWDKGFASRFSEPPWDIFNRAEIKEKDLVIRQKQLNNKLRLHKSAKTALRDACEKSFLRWKESQETASTARTDDELWFSFLDLKVKGKDYVQWLFRVIFFDADDPMKNLVGTAKRKSIKEGATEGEQAGPQSQWYSFNLFDHLSSPMCTVRQYMKRLKMEAKSRIDGRSSEKDTGGPPKPKSQLPSSVDSNTATSAEEVSSTGVDQPVQREKRPHEELSDSEVETSAPQRERISKVAREMNSLSAVVSSTLPTSGDDVEFFGSEELDTAEGLRHDIEDEQMKLDDVKFRLTKLDSSIIETSARNKAMQSRLNAVFDSVREVLSTMHNTLISDSTRSTELKIKQNSVII